jgi:RHS repeat-associated protein
MKPLLDILKINRNGNLLSLDRNGIGSELEMDRFIYNYHTLNGEQSNRLNYVVDNGIDYSSYDDIKSGQTSGNYTYNKIGELVSDNSENMILHWRTGDHKLARIERTDENSPELEFVYNPFGQRVMKIEKIRANGVLTGEVKNSYYAYDANSLSRCIHSSLTLFRRSNVTIGRQVMAIYSWNFQGNSEQIKLSEQHLYGADRLGMINRDVVVYDNGVTSYTHKEENVVHVDERGRKTFELTNHLGNVLATINDRKLYNELDGNHESVTKSFSDYYAFGMLMPNRQGGNHGRYLFNGMEHDGEVSGTGNSYTTEFRQYDARLAKWKSLDPLMHMFPEMSPYVAFDNNPVYFTDPLGLAAEGGGPPKGSRANKGTTSSGALKHKGSSDFFEKLGNAIRDVASSIKHGVVSFLEKTDRFMDRIAGNTHISGATEIKDSRHDFMIGNKRDVHFAPPDSKVTQIELADLEIFALIIDAADLTLKKKAASRVKKKQYKSKDWTAWRKTQAKHAYKKYHKEGEHWMTTYGRMFRKYQNKVAQMNKEQLDRFTEIALEYVANSMINSYIWTIKVGASMPHDGTNLTKPALEKVDDSGTSYNDRRDRLHTDINGDTILFYINLGTFDNPKYMGPTKNKGTYEKK